MQDRRSTDQNGKKANISNEESNSKHRKGHDVFLWKIACVFLPCTVRNLKLERRRPEYFSDSPQFRRVFKSKLF
jgi:hypothetical protein